MSLPETIASFGWYGASWSILGGEPQNPDFYPLPDDLEAQHEWLDGFHGAWVDHPDAAPGGDVAALDRGTITILASGNCPVA